VSRTLPTAGEREMKIPLYIEKNSAKDCDFDCIFRDIDLQKCNLFNGDLIKTGYYDSASFEAVHKCQAMYRKQQGE
jgi:hypothetical protein